MVIAAPPASPPRAAEMRTSLIGVSWTDTRDSLTDAARVGKIMLPAHELPAAKLELPHLA